MLTIILFGLVFTFLTVGVLANLDVLSPSEFFILAAGFLVVGLCCSQDVTPWPTTPVTWLEWILLDDPPHAVMKLCMVICPVLLGLGVLFAVVLKSR